MCLFLSLELLTIDIYSQYTKTYSTIFRKLGISIFLLHVTTGRAMSHLFNVLRLDMLQHIGLYLETWEIPSKLYKRRTHAMLSHSAESRGRGRRYQIGELSLNYFRTLSISFRNNYTTSIISVWVLISNRIVIIQVRFNIIGYRCFLPP